MEESHPHLAPLLATPCDLLGYEKPLDREGFLRSITEEVVVRTIVCACAVAVAAALGVAGSAPGRRRSGYAAPA